MEKTPLVAYLERLVDFKWIDKDNVYIDVEDNEADVLYKFNRCLQDVYHRASTLEKMIDKRGIVTAPPLDGYSLDFRDVVEFKMTTYFPPELDGLRYGGMGVDYWKLNNLRLATGFRLRGGPPQLSNVFEYGWYVYYSPKTPLIYMMSVTQIEQAIHDLGLQPQAWERSDQQYVRGTGYFIPSRRWSVFPAQSV